MSNAWNEGYFTDSGYTYGYYPETNPLYQRFCLLLRGFAVAPPPGADARHCELGFGQGVSINLNAAATPGQYVGTDFNPAHASHAAGLAAAAGSGARLLDDSFEQLLARSDLPQFDSISLHGIWTWVSRENQSTIVEFARRRLKPGGVLYISYNCFPGWSPAFPLRQLLALHDRYGAGTAGDAGGRVDEALKFSQALLEAQPLYAKAVAGLPERLAKMQGQDRNYLAHEYLNREWNCMYFTDVVDALAPAKLDYACTAVPLDGVDVLNVGTSGAEFLKGIAHPVLREQARDYFVNRQFRKDLFVRGAIRMTGVEQRDRLLKARLALVKPVAEVTLKATGPAGTADLQPAIYQPLLETLAARQMQPKTVAELAAALPGQSLAALLQAVTILVGQGAAAPCQDDAAAGAVRKRCDALNAHLLARSAVSANVAALASPVLGGGIGVQRIDQLFLLARSKGQKNPGDWAQFAWQALKGVGQKLLREGKLLESDEDNLQELNQRAAAFAQGMLPVLRALQVVA